MIVDLSVISVTDDISNYDDGDIPITVASLIRVIWPYRIPVMMMAS